MDITLLQCSCSPRDSGGRTSTHSVRRTDSGESGEDALDNTLHKCDVAHDAHRDLTVFLQIPPLRILGLSAALRGIAGTLNHILPRTLSAPQDRPQAPLLRSSIATLPGRAAHTELVPSSDISQDA
jgi:hypothetical protein